jgi:hypothetical protein
MNKENPNSKKCCGSKNNLSSTANNLSSVDLVYASDYPEFFYESSGEPVAEGDAVGFEFYDSETSDLVLFSDVYFQHPSSIFDD